MKGTDMFKVIAMLVATMVPAPGSAQTSNDEREVRRLHQMAQRWEERSKGYLWVWDLTTSVWFSSGSDPMHNIRVPPKGAKQKKNLRISICKDAQQVVVTGSLPTFGLPVELARRLQATLAAEHGAKDIYLPTEAIAGRTTIVRVYRGRIGISYDVPLPNRPPRGSTMGNRTPPPPPLPITVWQCKTECRRQRDISAVGEESLFMAMLSMENPFRLFGCEWKITSRSRDTVTLSCIEPAGWEGNVVRITVDRHTGQLRQYEILSAEHETLSLSWRIHYSSRNGLFVPTYATRKVVQRESGRWKHFLYQFSLNRLSKTSTCDFQLPIGNLVMDYRLSVGVTFDNFGTPDILKHVVQYRWDGSLPNDLELKRKAYQQGKLPSAGKGLRATWALLVPGVLLLALALFLYRRMRQTV